MAGDLRKFLIQFRKSPRSVGAILPSSRALAEAMIAPINFAKASVVVEFGPGTGVMTAAIARKLAPQARYFGIELNAEFHETLTGRFPALDFFNRSAADIREILEAAGVDTVDAIVCGLPWASLPVEQQRRILDGVERVLRPGAIFVTFAYLQGLLLPAAWALRRRLKQQFASVDTTPVVWGNAPPAFAYVCRK